MALFRFNFQGHSVEAEGRDYAEAFAKLGMCASQMRGQGYSGWELVPGSLQRRDGEKG